MEVDSEQPHENEGESAKDKRMVLKRLFGWFKALLAWLKDEIGLGPLFTLSSLVTAIYAVIVATYHFEADVLMKQLSENRARYEGTWSEMQNKLEERIPERVRSPLPIFPKNEISLVRRAPKEGQKEMDLV